MTFTLAVTATEINLEGKEFCRTVQTDGSFGQPIGLREHCVSFSNGKINDNGYTLFGYPATTLPYRIVDDSKIYTTEDGTETLSFDILDNGQKLGSVSDVSDEYNYILDLKVVPKPCNN